MARRSRDRFCGSAEHSLSRRSFLAGVGSGAAALTGVNGIHALAEPALAGEMKKSGKRVILLWLAGGASQLETWDPKPGRKTGGPFQEIQTSVPGCTISELMPKMATRLHQHTALIRSLNTKVGDHGGGADLMMRGRRDEPNLRYPDMGAVLARELGQADSKVPDYVSMYTSTEGRRTGTSGFLGARYAPIVLTDKMVPENLKRVEALSQQDHEQRAELRKLLNDRFSRGRHNSVVGSHAEAYARVPGLMGSESLFDISQESQATRDRYGPTQFGQQALVARRLVEAGVPFVRVARAWWDSHGQNFETHLELVTELDHVMSTLLDDLGEGGLLGDVQVITLAEFGRTPNINASLGRDHFASAWSCSLSGAGIKPGIVYGKTDEDGQRVADGEMGAAELLATIFKSLGINPHQDYYVGARPIPLTDPGTEPVLDVIA